MIHYSFFFLILPFDFRFTITLTIFIIYIYSIGANKVVNEAKKAIELCKEENLEA